MHHRKSAGKKRVGHNFCPSICDKNLDVALVYVFYWKFVGEGEVLCFECIFLVEVKRMCQLQGILLHLGVKDVLWKVEGIRLAVTKLGVSKSYHKFQWGSLGRFVAVSNGNQRSSNSDY